MIDDATLNKCLELLLAAGADFADIFAERGRFYNSVSDDRKISTSWADQIGVGIRAVKDFADYYITCDSFEPAQLLKRTAELASGLKTTVSGRPVALRAKAVPTVYEPAQDPHNRPLTDKIDLLKRTEEVAWGCSPKIKQATLRYSDFEREIQLASTADEKVLRHKLALVEFLAIIYAGDGNGRQLGWAGKSFYCGWEAFEGDYAPEELVRKACCQAVQMLEARECPAGEMPVVFAPGPNGVLFHESCGHGMEADLVLKGSSFAGQLGQQVASEKVTIRDSGLVPGFPGSFAIDDEGVESQSTTLIEGGVLNSYLQSRITARQTGAGPTGSGRRQSFRFPPLPRMRNTYIERGQDDPQEIIRSTKRGLYAADVGFGGQVDVVTGRFITSIILGYLIEDGHLTTPVRGATITGVGIEALKDIDMVGSDLVMDPCYGRCGKGQEVPVGVGMPTVRVRKLVVGGTGSPLRA